MWDAGRQKVRQIAAERVDFFQFGLGLVKHAQFDVATSRSQILLMGFARGITGGLTAVPNGSVVA